VNKALLKRLATELRAEIDLGPHAPFDPYRLAELYGVDVIQMSDLDCSREAIRHFQVLRRDVFSGALVPLAYGGSVIIENDAHPVERRRSTASHEMSHVALEHEFGATLTDERRCSLASVQQEKEAAELGGELLLPFEAAKRLAWQGVTDQDAATRFGVSLEIARWRLNATGARRIAQRARARR
jgi:Zn-dependent peptidase ImmA (M78 family)